MKLTHFMRKDWRPIPSWRGLFYNAYPLSTLLRHLCLVALMTLVAMAGVTGVTARAEPSAINTPAPYVYSENFEKHDPFLPWTSNGSYTLHYKGLTDEKSFSGKRSFKLDITLGTAKYVYFRIPADIPVSNGLSFQADVYLSRDDGVGVALGPEILYRPSPFEGYLNDRYIRQTGQWVPVTYDLATEAERIGSRVLKQHAGGATMRDVVPWMDQVGIYLFSETGGRVTMYVDNIQVKGRALNKNSQRQLANARWERYLARVRDEASSLVAQVKSVSKTLRVGQDVQYGEEARRNAQAVTQSIATRGFPDGVTYSRLQQDVKQLQSLKQNESQGGSCSPRLSLYPRKAISNDWPDPDQYPLAEPAGKELVVRATPGEYEATAFTIHAFEKLSSVDIAVGKLQGASGSVRPDAVDVRLVKYWYQSGKGTISRQWKLHWISQSFLLPELLVHDDKLVKVDTHREINYLRTTGQGGASYLDISSTPAALPKDIAVSDAATLQPFTVEKGENKQAWITVHVPRDQKPGVYMAPVEVTVDGQPCGSLDLKLEVLPFHLAQPAVEYAIYYRGTINDQADSLTDGPKTLDQYTKELEDIRSHGIEAATVYDEEPRVAQALELRRMLGFRTDKALLVGTGTGTPKNEEERGSLTKRVNQQVTEALKAGYTETYLYGKEESHGAEILKQLKTWRAVHLSGGKVFTAVYPEAVKYAGDILDMAIVANVVDKNLANAWHLHGKLIYNYSNPQSGIEEPETYRRNYGLDLWCAGYDGAMLYAYQAQMGPSIWNDFDDPVYRDHVFAYPTSNGVVDTIEWDGLREGIDDVRYATTLSKVPGVSSASIRREICEKLSVSENLDSIRGWIIEQIMTLRGESLR
ncbi:MAG: hypothetical protein ACYDBW_00160 [Sulfuricaulis sp.]